MNIVELVQSQMNLDRIADVLNYYGVNRVHNFGSTIRCTCPIHGGDNPTSFVWKDNGLWFCHTACGRGGDVFNFVAEMENLDDETNFKEVANKVAQISNIDVTNVTYNAKTRENLKELEQWKRSVMNKKTICKTEEYNLAKLGELKDISRYIGISEKTLRRFEVSYSKDMDRIVFPIRDESGTCIGATMRRRDNNNPIKWLHYPTGIKVGEYLYGMHLNLGNTPWIVEGAIDVLKLRDLDIFALGCFGAKLTDEQAKILIRNFTSVNLMYDGDKAGLDATYSAIQKLKGKMDINVYVLPWGVDPGAITPNTWEDIKIYKPYEFEEMYKNMEQCV